MSRAHIAEGSVDADFQPVRDYLNGELAVDTDYAFQLVAYRGAELVIDLWGGPEMERDSIMVPFSVSKNAVAIALALLVQRGELELDETVARYWPEFAQQGKAAVTVRQLLSHQAGLSQPQPPLSNEEILDSHKGAQRLATQKPLWRPGATFGYHAVTIGTLASELVFRLTGLTIQEFYEREIRAPRNIDFYLGLPESEEARVLELLPMIAPSGVASAEPVFARSRGQLGAYTFGIGGSAEHLTLEEQRRVRRQERAVGIPAASGTASARGIASLFVESVHGLNREPLLTPETVDEFAQLQVVGVDRNIGIERSHGIVFQKPVSNLNFGSFAAFGHDGVAGALGFHDPSYDLSFGYTVRRMPYPGGADQRALHATTLVQDAIVGA